MGHDDNHNHRQLDYPPAPAAATDAPAAIPLTAAEAAEALRLERNYARAHDLLHVAENDLQRYVAHLVAIHRVPEGYRLRDYLVGFEPVAAETGEGANDG